MKIVHIGLAAHYTESMNYQDEILPKINLMDGHDVTYISDVYEFSDGKLCKCKECDIVLDNGLRLIRIDYDYVLSEGLSKKIIKVKKLSEILNDIKPDTILYHGIGGYSLKYIVEYKQLHPEVIIYADCHASFDNSSRNVLSKLFNKYFHGHYIKKALPSLEKILYVGDESKLYLQQMYKISDEMLEWFPLGGNIVPYSFKKEKRQLLISQYDLREDSIIFSHSGKINKEKRTLELVSAFKAVPDIRFRLFIIGSIEEEIRNDFENMIKDDKRIKYVGWKSGSELQDFLLASDLYCQPGTVSATLQNALCAGTAVLTYPWDGYLRFGDSFVFKTRSQEDIISVFQTISLNHCSLEERGMRAYEYAKLNLDYNVLAKRIYK